VGKKDGCLQPEGKDVQAQDRVGQPAVEMAESSNKTKRLKRTEDYFPLARAVVPTVEAYQEKISFKALDLFPLLGEARRCHRIFLHLLSHPTDPRKSPETQVRDRICLPWAWGSGLDLSLP